MCAWPRIVVGDAQHATTRGKSSSLLVRIHYVVGGDPDTPGSGPRSGDDMTNTGGTPAGWYYAPGDPEGTQRYWDGAQWIGEPQAVPQQPAPAATPDPAPAAPDYDQTVQYRHRPSRRRHPPGSIKRPGRTRLRPRHPTTALPARNRRATNRRQPVTSSPVTSSRRPPTAQRHPGTRTTVPPARTSAHPPNGGRASSLG